MDAFNSIRQAGWLGTLEVHYAFAKNSKGVMGVELWSGPRQAPHGGVRWVSCVDLIAAGEDAEKKIRQDLAESVIPSLQ